MHHEFKSPIALAALYAHPVEVAFGNVLAVMGPSMLLGLNLFTWMIFVAAGSMPSLQVSSAPSRTTAATDFLGFLAGTFNQISMISTTKSSKETTVCWAGWTAYMGRTLSGRRKLANQDDLFTSDVSLDLVVLGVGPGDVQVNQRLVLGQGQLLARAGVEVVVQGRPGAVA